MFPLASLEHLHGRVYFVVSRVLFVERWDQVEEMVEDRGGGGRGKVGEVSLYILKICVFVLKLIFFFMVLNFLFSVLNGEICFFCTKLENACFCTKFLSFLY